MWRREEVAVRMPAVVYPFFQLPLSVWEGREEEGREGGREGGSQKGYHVGDHNKPFLPPSLLPSFSSFPPYLSSSSASLLLCLRCSTSGSTKKTWPSVLKRVRESGRQGRGEGGREGGGEATSGQVDRPPPGQKMDD